MPASKVLGEGEGGRPVDESGLVHHDAAALEHDGSGRGLAHGAVTLDGHLDLGGLPYVEVPGAWTALTFTLVLQVEMVTLSTYQPSTPPQPSRPMSKRSWIL